MTGPRRLALAACACVCVAGGTSPAIAGEPTAELHERRAALAVANGDHAGAATELAEAFWLTRNSSFLLGAAQMAEVAGVRDEALTYYFLYVNLAPIDATDVDRLRNKITSLRWDPPAAAPTVSPEKPAPARRPAVTLRSPRIDEDDDGRWRAVDPEVDRQVETVRYWHQILLADGLSIALLASDESGLVALGVLGVMFASPSVHVAHGKGVGGWFGAWGLRLLGAVLGIMADSGATGVLVGLGVASVVDAALLAEKEVVVSLPGVSVIPSARGLSLAWTF